MSSQTVMLRVPIADDWDAGDRVQVFTDFGGGVVDTTRPLINGGFDVFPDQNRAVGFGEQPFGTGRFGDHQAVRSGRGIGNTQFGVTPFGMDDPHVMIPVQVPAAFGTWKFAVQVIDGFGNAQSGAMQKLDAVVSGTEPMPLTDFSFNGFDAVNDQAVFNLEYTEE